MFAYRNTRLCSKDCICLYVCPTGATDTDNGIIDESKCISGESGCRACADACPAGAISLIPEYYPPPQVKAEAVVTAQWALVRSKVIQEEIAESIAAASDSAVTRQFAGAVVKSNRLMAEVLLAEAGYMMPQSPAVRELLTQMLTDAPADFPKAAVELLLREKTR